MSGYSVVIPAFNAAATLAAALESVLAQRPAPLEILVIDDGSTDDTGNAARSFGAPVRVIRQDNAGPGSATTRGFSEAKAPLIATIDADDLWLPGKAALQLGRLAAEPGLAAVFGKYREFKEGGEPRAEVYDGWLRSCMTVRTDIARAVGPVIDPPGFSGDMVDWLARMREAGHRQEMLAEVVTLRRIRPGSLSYGRSHAAEAGYLFVVREAMKRRKAREAAEKSRRI